MPPAVIEEAEADLLEAPETVQPSAEPVLAPAALPGLTIERLQDGSLEIAAPAALAAPLAQLLEQLAQGLRGATAAQ